MSNPFDGDSDDGDAVLLSKLATVVVMPPESATRLLDAGNLGRQEVKSFISKRLNSNELGFWDPVSKLKIQTFASMAKNGESKVCKRETFDCKC